MVTWSTVTSATGLPTLEPEPSRSRSSSYWKVDNFFERHFRYSVQRNTQILQQKNEAQPQATQEANITAENLKDMLGRALSLDQIDSLIQVRFHGETDW